MNPLSETHGRKKFPAMFLAAFFLFWCCFYALTVRGVPSNGDPVNYYVVAQSIAERGTVALGINHYVPLELGADGKYYSKFGIGQSLAEVPFHWLGRAIAPRTDNQAYRNMFIYFITEMSVPVLCALICLLFALIGVELGYSLRVSAGAALLLGLATLIWPYSKIGFSEPLQGASLAAAFLFALRSRNSVAAAALSGFAAGLLILTKTANLIVIPLFVFYYLADGNKNAKSRLLNAAVFLIQFSIFFILMLIYNKIRFGGLLNFGYDTGKDAAYGFSVAPLSGLYGFLFSPGKSIFVYSPVLVAALFGASAFHRRHRAESWLLWSAAAALTVVYSCWWAWHGDWCWGPRFLVPLVPLLALPLLPLLESFHRWRYEYKACFVLLIGVSLFVQVLGSSVSFYEYIMIVRHQEPYNMFVAPAGVKPRDDQLNTHFIPEFSPIAGHAWLLKHTLMGRNQTPAKIRESMRADFPWRTLMRYAPPGNPETGIGLDAWWRYFPELFPESAPWARRLLIFLGGSAIFALCASALIASKFPALRSSGAPAPEDG
jgi:hypothetical protein